jgi:aspartyl-tRNA(Asn)/glutamyl-tRNA(Gln) amidotransferase subunit A
LAAEAADTAIRAGHAVGPLHGIPIALKDLVEIEGRVTTGGSKVWQDRLSTTTATLVRKVKAAGMIVIGKTHSVEFAGRLGHQSIHGDTVESVGP